MACVARQTTNPAERHAAQQPEPELLGTATGNLCRSGVCCAHHTARSPGSHAAMSPQGFRPSALRPTLSDELPFSGFDTRPIQQRSSVEPVLSKLHTSP
jgi:hypothetical protein